MLHITSRLRFNFGACSFCDFGFFCKIISSLREQYHHSKTLRKIPDISREIKKKHFRDLTVAQINDRHRCQLAVHWCQLAVHWATIRKRSLWTIDFDFEWFSGCNFLKYWDRADEPTYFWISYSYIHSCVQLPICQCRKLNAYSHGKSIELWRISGKH